jgi:hypothetical protein
VTVDVGDLIDDPAAREQLAAGIATLQQAKGTAPSG